MEGLSINERKISLYNEDPYFFESLSYFSNKLDQESFNYFISKFASIIIKPESFFEGKGTEIVNYYKDNDFIPVYYKFLDINKYMLRAIWMYQLNAATLDRLNLLDEWSNQSKMLHILLLCTKDILTPATVEVTNLRGSSNIDKHKPHELRSQLGQVIPMINYLHSADEPADMIRDIGILYSKKDILNLISLINEPTNVLTRITSSILEYTAYLGYQNLSYDFILNKISRQELNDFLDSDHFTLDELEVLLSDECIELTSFEKIIIASRNCKLTRLKVKNKISSVLNYR